MQIPSIQPFQPPVRPTRIPTSGNLAKSSENTSANGASDPHTVTGEPFTASAYEPIQQAMNNLPDSRADVVARGKALAADSTYPALKIISKLANLFLADAQASLVGDQ